MTRLYAWFGARKTFQGTVCTSGEAGNGVVRMSDASALFGDAMLDTGVLMVGISIVCRCVIICLLIPSFAGRLCSLRGDCGSVGSRFERRLKIEVDLLRSDGDCGCSTAIILPDGALPT